MSIDFRALQIQANKIIASGSTGRNALLVIYPHSKSDLLNTGGIDPLKFPATGIGEDVFLYVSGAVGGKDGSGNGITVIGGDTNVSGSLTVGSHNLSLSDPSASYILATATASLPNSKVLAAGPNITITSYSTFVAISGSTGGADPDATYILVSATGTLPNAKALAAGPNVTINDYGSTLAISGTLTNIRTTALIHPDAIPTSSHAISDEFTGSYAAGTPTNWTSWDVFNYLTSSITGTGFLNLRAQGLSVGGSIRNSGVYKDVSSYSEFTIVSRLLAHYQEDGVSINHNRIGLFIGENLGAAPSTANLITMTSICPYVGATEAQYTYKACVINSNTNTEGQDVFELGGALTRGIYARIRVSASNYWQDYSTDGLGWSNIASGTVGADISSISVAGVYVQSGADDNYPVDAKIQFFRFYEGVSSFSFNSWGEI